MKRRTISTSLSRSRPGHNHSPNVARMSHCAAASSGRPMISSAIDAISRESVSQSPPRPGTTLFMITCPRGWARMSSRATTTAVDYGRTDRADDLHREPQGHGLHDLGLTSDVPVDRGRRAVHPLCERADGECFEPFPQHDV